MEGPQKRLNNAKVRSQGFELAYLPTPASSHSPPYLSFLLLTPLHSSSVTYQDFVTRQRNALGFNSAALEAIDDKLTSLKYTFPFLPSPLAFSPIRDNSSPSYQQMPPLRVRPPLGPPTQEIPLVI